MPACRLCRSPRLRFVTDFGRLAVTNQFLRDSRETAWRQPLSWVACDACGVVQLSDTAPIEQIRPHFHWIAYQEPERHLDAFAEAILRVTSLQSGGRVIGLTYKDAPLLSRIRVGEVRQLDPRSDLGIEHEQFGLETIQAHWTVDRAAAVAAHHGLADILIARHVLEHAYDTREFLEACRRLLAPDGVLCVEVPDCGRAFQDIDVGVLWEEHVLYFTENTLQQGLHSAGFQLEEFLRAPYTLEDCLVWIGRKLPGSTESDSASDCSDVNNFADGWRRRRDQVQAWSRRMRQDGGRIAVYGAGHRACTLVDLMGLAGDLECIIDDAPHKQALYFPAGTLPIRSSQALLDERITCCLLAVNPDVEERIVQRNAEFVQRRGTVVSCAPGSPRAWRLS
jgi:SAM-dependent methyltransferase